MNSDEVRAAAAELVGMHQRFAPLFGRKEAQAHSLEYLNGLLLCPERKSAEPIALAFGLPGPNGPDQNQVIALQRFLSVSGWSALKVQREIQRVFAEQFVPAGAGSIGTVGILDGSTFVKKGDESVGVQRQHCGRLGKVENCQAGVFLTAATPAGTALLDQQLYLPKEWAANADRRKKVHVPEAIRFQTQLEIGIELLRRTRAAGIVHFDWVVADEGFGHSQQFLAALETSGQRYLAEVPRTTAVWTAGDLPPYSGRGRQPRRSRRNAKRSVQQVAESLPADAWHNYQLRLGAMGPLVFQFAAVRVSATRRHKEGPPVWLVIRKTLGPKIEVKYYLSNAAADTSLETLALVSGCRFRVEEFFEEAKSYLGMAQYEARGWPSWHHHMSLVALAHLFVSLTRLRLKKKTSSLTLDMALRLLRATLPMPNLDDEFAIAIIIYHVRRNHTARLSHTKTWRRRHQDVPYKVLL
jgi:SRSO17 transposase